MSRRSRPSPGSFSLTGEGLNVGKDAAEPVTDDYPGESPWPFVGGTTHGSPTSPWIDLQKEVVAAFARD